MTLAIPALSQVHICFLSTFSLLTNRHIHHFTMPHDLPPSTICQIEWDLLYVRILLIGDDVQSFFFTYREARLTDPAYPDVTPQLNVYCWEWSKSN